MEILNMNVSELKKLAKNNNVKKYYTMRKAELINALLELKQNGIKLDDSILSPKEKISSDFEKMKRHVNKIKPDGKTDFEILKEVEEETNKYETILNGREQKEILKFIKSKIKIKDKVIYTEKDNVILIIKEIGRTNDLYDKYSNANGYKNTKVLVYEKAFGLKPNTNKRRIKACEFIRKHADPDINVKYEEVTMNELQL